MYDDLPSTSTVSHNKKLNTMWFLFLMEILGPLVLNIPSIPDSVLDVANSHPQITVSKESKGKGERGKIVN